MTSHDFLLSFNTNVGCFVMGQAVGVSDKMYFERIGLTMKPNWCRLPITLFRPGCHIFDKTHSFANLYQLC